MNHSELKCPALPSQDRTQQLTNAYASSKQSLTQTQKAKTGKMPIPGQHLDLGQVLEPNNKKSQLMMPSLFPMSSGIDGKITQPQKSKLYGKNIQLDTFIPTKHHHNHTNSQGPADGSKGLLPGTSESIGSPGKREYRILQKLPSPRAGDREADYLSNQPGQKT